jgi:hypothetical protein
LVLDSWGVCEGIIFTIYDRNARIHDDADGITGTIDTKASNFELLAQPFAL